MNKIIICKTVIKRIQKEISNFKHLSEKLPYNNDAHKKAVEVYSFELLRKDIESLQEINKFKRDAKAVLLLIDKKEPKELSCEIKKIEKKLEQYCMRVDNRTKLSVNTKMSIVVAIITVIFGLVTIFIPKNETISTKGDYSPIVRSIEHIGDYVEGDKNEIHYHLSPEKAPIK